MNFTEKKFLSFPLKKQHKKASEHLRLLFDLQKIDPTYRQMEEWLHLPPIPNKQEAIADRFHLHIRAANISLKEHHLLVKRYDSLSTTPYGSIGIYLENLRSAHNVGSILRSVEAFRLGTVYFSDTTPFADHPKVISTAMGAASHVPCGRKTLEALPRPLIALETVESAPSIFEFPFPKTFTLLVGNEEYGLSKNTLEKADHIVQIPLPGSKNSLNVSCAFAIIAAHLCNQFSTIGKDRV